MYDLLVWKNRRTEKSNTYSITQNQDGTITLTPVVGEVIEAGTSFNQQNMNHMDNGINEAMIVANMAIVQLLQHQRELENTYFEIGETSIKSSEDYPFNKESVTVAIKEKRNTLDYIVIAFCDNVQQGRAIRIKDKQLNGFKIEVEDCPKEPVTIKYFILGGMM
jgi:hypothetical protein